MRFRRRRPGWRVPGFSQGKPEDPRLPRVTYGADGTIHQTGTVDVQVSEETGEVLAVWFRCLNLPFTVSTVPGATVCNPGKMAVESVVYVTRESARA